MSDTEILYNAIDWGTVPKTEHKGETGTSFWQSLEFPGLRIRVVEYSAGYKADHWCSKGHVVLCLEGEFVNELQTGEKNVLKKGMGYVVSDGASTHRSISENGARLFIVDGEFLKKQVTPEKF
jgi:hypothetical protein